MNQTIVKTATLEIGLMLEEIDRRLAEAYACQKTSVERGWKEGATYSIAGHHLPGRALLVAIIGEGGEAMVQRRELKTCPQATKDIKGLAKWAEATEMTEAAGKLREIAGEIEGPDNITVDGAIDALLDARSVLQQA